MTMESKNNKLDPFMADLPQDAFGANYFADIEASYASTHKFSAEMRNLIQQAYSVHNYVTQDSLSAFNQYLSDSIKKFDDSLGEDEFHAFKHGLDVCCCSLELLLKNYRKEDREYYNELSEEIKTFKSLKEEIHALSNGALYQIK